MKKFVSVICIIVVMLTSITVCYADIEVDANSVVLASLKSQQTLYSKNQDFKVAPAELTKLMTAYTAFKIFGADKSVKVPGDIKKYTDYTETVMDLEGGERLTSGDLIYGMLMGQANDAAIAVALTYGGEKEFVARMNDYAKGLGMVNTHFENVTGKENEKQYTTAEDLLKLYRAYYSSKKLYPYISQKSVTLPATDKSSERVIWTKNHLMSRYIYLDYYYDYATAGVSSSTTYGGYSVISSAAKGTKELVAIVLDAPKRDNKNCAMTDAVKMFNYGFDKYSTVTITKKGDLLYEANLKNQWGKNKMLLESEKTLKALVLDNDTSENVERKILIDDPVSAPIKKGDVVAKAVYTYNGNIVGEINLLATDNSRRSIFKTIFSGISWFFGLKAIKIILISIGCFIAIIIVLILNSINKNKKRRRRRKRATRITNFR